MGRLFSAQGTGTEKTLRGEPAWPPDEEGRGTVVAAEEGVGGMPH